MGGVYQKPTHSEGIRPSELSEPVWQTGTRGKSELKKDPRSFSGPQGGKKNGFTKSVGGNVTG